MDPERGDEVRPVECAEGSPHGILAIDAYFDSHGRPVESQKPAVDRHASCLDDIPYCRILEKVAREWTRWLVLDHPVNSNQCTHVNHHLRAQPLARRRLLTVFVQESHGLVDLRALTKYILLLANVSNAVLNLVHLREQPIHAQELGRRPGFNDSALVENYHLIRVTNS